MIWNLSYFRQLLFVILCLAVSYGLASDAHAQLTHYVPFDAGYTVGNSLSGAGGSDLGFGTNTWFEADNPGSDVVAGNLNPPQPLLAAGNHARTATSDFQRLFYTMDQNNNGVNGEAEDRLQPGENWVSFVARSEVAADFGGFSFVKFFGDEVLYIGKVGGNGGTQWGLDQGSGGAVAAGGDITQDTLLVAKLTLGPGANDDTADLYINPPLGATPPGTPDLAGYAFNEDPAGNRAIDEIRLGSLSGPFYADEIRIGRTFADVTVPEPAAAVLMLLGLAAVGSVARPARRVT